MCIYIYIYRIIRIYIYILVYIYMYIYIPGPSFVLQFIDLLGQRLLMEVSPRKVVLDQNDQFLIFWCSCNSTPSNISCEHKNPSRTSVNLFELIWLCNSGYGVPKTTRMHKPFWDNHHHHHYHHSPIHPYIHPLVAQGVVVLSSRLRWAACEVKDRYKRIKRWWDILWYIYIYPQFKVRHSYDRAKHINTMVVLASLSKMFQTRVLFDQISFQFRAVWWLGSVGRAKPPAEWRRPGIFAHLNGNEIETSNHIGLDAIEIGSIVRLLTHWFCFGQLWDHGAAGLQK